MKVFFYHLYPVARNFELWKKGEFPGHLLYGITHFEKYNIECEYYGEEFNPWVKRVKLMLYNLRKLLRKDFDMIYAVSFRGLELLILLRAIGLYRKPIIVWHHTAVVNPSGFFRRQLSRIFYKGIDKMFFFSEELIRRSMQTGKVPAENAILAHWGGRFNILCPIRRKEIRTTRAFCVYRGGKPGFCDVD